MCSSGNMMRQKLVVDKEGRAGLAAELVLIHSSSASHWLCLFQLARCFHILFPDPGKGSGREAEKAVNAHRSHYATAMVAGGVEVLVSRGCRAAAFYSEVSPTSRGL